MLFDYSAPAGVRSGKNVNCSNSVRCSGEKLLQEQCFLARQILDQKAIIPARDPEFYRKMIHRITAMLDALLKPRMRYFLPSKNIKQLVRHSLPTRS
jgi:hypothetical protein